MAAIGNEIGKVRRTVMYKTGDNHAPALTPFLCIMAWGTISPKITMTAVEAAKAIAPPAISFIKMATTELTQTFPKIIAHKRRLPRLRRGSNFFA